MASTRWLGPLTPSQWPLPWGGSGAHLRGRLSALVPGKSVEQRLVSGAGEGVRCEVGAEPCWLCQSRVCTHVEIPEKL